MNLGQKIRDFRRERGLTLTRLAGKLGVSPSHLSAIERNLRKPSIRMLKKIGNHLNIPANYLVSSEEGVLTGKKLEYIRESRGLSLEDLSEICDIPVRTLELIETGRDIPDLECLKRLSLGLNVTIKYFLDESSSNILGQRLKKVRMSRGRTIQWLSGETGLDPEIIARVENGQSTPSLETLEIISSSLNTSPTYLLMESRDVEDLLATLGDELLEALGEPGVQSALKSLKDFQPDDIRHIINYIHFFKQNRPKV